ncbi:MAG: hypothetical protein HY397_00415 [Candidatus Doudnabacteria bacterium]|nr:hypothetical protein [Candidatus Doudnabacteria bacterium]
MKYEELLEKAGVTADKQPNVHRICLRPWPGHNFIPDSRWNVQDGSPAPIVVVTNSKEVVLRLMGLPPADQYAVVATLLAEVDDRADEEGAFLDIVSGERTFLASMTETDRTSHCCLHIS